MDYPVFARQFIASYQGAIPFIEVHSKLVLK